MISATLIPLQYETWHYNTILLIGTIVAKSVKSDEVQTRTLTV